MTVYQSDYVGYMTLSNPSGIVIVEFIDKFYNPYVKIDIVAFNDICTTKTLKIYHSTKGAYFNLYRTRIYLNEFIRVLI